MTSGASRKPQSEPSFVEPLTALLHGLYLRGFAVGVDDALRVAAVFRHGDGWSRERRVQVLKALVARSDEERRLIEQLAPHLFVEIRDLRAPEIDGSGAGSDPAIPQASADQESSPLPVVPHGNLGTAPPPLQDDDPAPQYPREESREVLITGSSPNRAAANLEMLADSEGPRTYRLEVSEPTAPLDRSLVYEAAFHLSAPRIPAQAPWLAGRRTVEATAAQGGRLRLRYARRLTHSPVLFLEDVSASMACWPDHGRQLGKAFERQGNEVVHYFMSGTPDDLAADRSMSRRLQWSQVVESMGRPTVLILSDAQALDPANRRRADWLGTFRKAVWLHPQPPELWGLGARWLAGQAQIVSLSGDGMLRLTAFRRETGELPPRWRPARPCARADASARLLAIRSAVGEEAYWWLCAGAVFASQHALSARLWWKLTEEILDVPLPGLQRVLALSDVRVAADGTVRLRDGLGRALLESLEDERPRLLADVVKWGAGLIVRDLESLPDDSLAAVGARALNGCLRILDVEQGKHGRQDLELLRSEGYGQWIRLDPDLLRSEIKLEVAPAADPLVWRTYDSKIDGKTMRIEVPQYMRWGITQELRAPATLARLRLDNLTRTGSGRVELELLPRVSVELGEYADKGLEPTYADRRSSFLRFAGANIASYLEEVKESLRWTLDNSRDLPVEFRVLFEPSRIRNIDRMLRLVPYRLILPLRYRLYESGEYTVSDQLLEIVLDFQVERYVGEYVLAVDFGASRIVAAFADTLTTALETRAGGGSRAILNLQSRYLEVLAERDQLEEREGLGFNQQADEASLPNREAGTPFIPSVTLWRPNKILGRPDFVYLPPTIPQMTREWGRAVYSLNALLLRGDDRLPTFAQLDTWQWVDDATLEISQDPPPVDGVLRSAYGNLMQQYIEPVLKADGRHELLDKLVFAHPNSFTLSHKERLREVLRQTLGERFRIDLLSESQAVLLYCACRPEQHLPGALDHRRQHVLVYDIGRGTLDFTYARLDWGDDGPLRRVEILFQAGKPVAGDQLDVSLARVIDSSIRYFQKQLRGFGIRLEYTYPIVGLDDSRFQIEEHLGLMYPVRQAIHNLKVELSEQARKHGDAPFVVEVPLDASPDIAKGLLSFRGRGARDPKVQDALRALKIRHTMTVESEHLHLPIASKDLFGHPAVRQWLERVSDEVIENLAGALSEMGHENPTIDSLIFTGRTSRFPPLRQRVLGAIEEHLKLPASRIHIPQLSSVKGQEIVALGALAYALMAREGVSFIDRNIWAKYGLIYETGRGRRFEEFFGYGTRPDPKRDLIEEKGGMQVVFFRRTREIHRVGGRVDVAVTYSHDPNTDLARPGWEEKFTVVKSLGRHHLGAGKQVKVRMSIAEDDRLEVVVDPDGFPRRISNLAYRPGAQLPQLDWPYRKLEGPVELERPLDQQSSEEAVN